MSEMLELLEKYEESEQWEKVISLCLRMLKSEPDDHYLLVSLSEAYSESRDYQKALEASKRALSSAPWCPLAIWSYACDLDMTGRELEAIALWKKLLHWGEERLAFGACHEGIRWAKITLNESRYRIGLSYMDLSRYGLAVRYMESHLNHRRRGLKSNFTKREVEKMLKRARGRRKTPGAESI
ncbi:MAG: hypothetical protein KKA42_03025 [candidate division Zixibacteria bacterium]|nr:hypothetical protein [candidate division Zixibacteria bacterium]